MLAATLLVADDDPGCASLERTLTREGYRVVLASDAAALERVQAGASPHRDRSPDAGRPGSSAPGGEGDLPTSTSSC